MPDIENRIVGGGFARALRNLRPADAFPNDAQEVPRARPIRWDEWLAGGPPRDKKKAIEGKRGEDLFQLILSGIREVYNVEACIAGGAVRDVAAGLSTHKDVDVFIPMDFKAFNENSHELGWVGGIAFMPQAKKAYEKCDVPSTARACSLVQGVDVDLVFVSEPLGVAGVDSFPIHTQRCAWTLADGMQVSPLAMDDITKKQFTIDPKITDKDRIKRLITKIEGWKKREGYRKWAIIEPDNKEWWEAKKEVVETDEIPFENKIEWQAMWLDEARQVQVINDWFGRNGN